MDISAVSAHGYSYTKDYVILRSGSSFGKAYGPIVIAKRNFDIEELKKIRIAVPGKMTTAYLLLRMVLGDFNVIEMRFNEINDAVEKDIVDAGLVSGPNKLKMVLVPNCLRTFATCFIAV